MPFCKFCGTLEKIMFLIPMLYFRDLSGKLAYNLGQTEVRNSFRRFMANFPDRYDYVKAQVRNYLTYSNSKS